METGPLVISHWYGHRAYITVSQLISNNHLSSRRVIDKTGLNQTFEILKRSQCECENAYLCTTLVGDETTVPHYLFSAKWYALSDMSRYFLQLWWRTCLTMNIVWSIAEDIVYKTQAKKTANKLQNLRQIDHGGCHFVYCTLGYDYIRFSDHVSYLDIGQSCAIEVNGNGSYIFQWYNQHSKDRQRIAIERERSKTVYGHMEL